MAEYRLTQEIIRRSVAQNWDAAKLEWTLEGIRFEEEPQTCLCGHAPIIEICTIANRNNGSVAEVGNCCVKKFLGLPSDRIFQSIKRVRKDDGKALNAEAIAHAHGRGWINNWERDWYFDTMRKRKLSVKQKAKREEINRLILARLADSGR